MSEKAKVIKAMIKNGTYDWSTAIEGAAVRILEYPESLLWR